jgi:hypothetical protein
VKGELTADDLGHFAEAALKRNTSDYRVTARWFGFTARFPLAVGRTPTEAEIAANECAKYLMTHRRRRMADPMLEQWDGASWVTLRSLDGER